MAEAAELAGLPAAIDAQERARDALFAQLADPAVLRDAVRVGAVRNDLAAIENALAALMARWEALESLEG